MELGWEEGWAGVEMERVSRAIVGGLMRQFCEGGLGDSPRRGAHLRLSHPTPVPVPEVVNSHPGGSLDAPLLCRRPTQMRERLE